MALFALRMLKNSFFWFAVVPIFTSDQERRMYSWIEALIHHNRICASEAALRLELLHGLHQADIAFGNSPRRPADHSRDSPSRSWRRDADARSRACGQPWHRHARHSAAPACILRAVQEWETADFPPYSVQDRLHTRNNGQGSSRHIILLQVPGRATRLRPRTPTASSHYTSRRITDSRNFRSGASRRVSTWMKG